jgi:hypothetical protein
MNKETIDKLNQIQRQMSALNMIKTRVDNEEGNFEVIFGVSIKEGSPFCPIINEESLTNALIIITKKYCEDKLTDLQKQLDNL